MAKKDVSVEVFPVVCADTGDLRFERKGDEVTLYSDGEAYGSMTIEQFRQVAKIIDGNVA